MITSPASLPCNKARGYLTMQGKFNQEAWAAAESQDTSDAVVGQLARDGLKLLNATNATEGEIRSMVGKCEVMAHAFARQNMQLTDVFSSCRNPVESAAAKSGAASARDLEAGFNNLAAQLRARLP